MGLSPKCPLLLHRIHLTIGSFILVLKRVSCQVLGLAAAARSEPWRPMLWGLGSFVRWQQGHPFPLEMWSAFWDVLRHCLMTSNEQPAYWLAFAEPFVCEPWDPIRLCNLWPSCYCSPVHGASVMEGPVTSTLGHHCEQGTAMQCCFGPNSRD